jgi:hypothetical protein
MDRYGRMYVNSIQLGPLSFLFRGTGDFNARIRGLVKWDDDWLHQKTPKEEWCQAWLSRGFTPYEVMICCYRSHGCQNRRTADVMMDLVHFTMSNPWVYYWIDWIDEYIISVDRAASFCQGECPVRAANRLVAPESHQQFWIEILHWNFRKLKKLSASLRDTM